MRAASARDAAACLEMYRPYVLNTAVGRDRYLRLDSARHRASGGRERYTAPLGGLTKRGLPAAFRRVAWMHDSWHDVAWLQLDLLNSVKGTQRLRAVT
jgi:L-amino acid N-acyltransferase YncA